MIEDDLSDVNNSISLEQAYYRLFNDEDISNVKQKNITILMKAGVKLYSYMIPFVGTFIIAINLVVVISSIMLFKRGQQPRNVYIFLGNVSLADLFTGIGVVLGSLIQKETRSQSTCNIIIGIIVGTSVISNINVTLIAFDRYVYIIHGINYKRWFYLKRVGALIVSSWIIGFIIGILPATSSRRDTIHGKVCWFILSPPEIILIITFTGLISITVSCILYSIILYHALKKVRQLKNMNSTDQSTSTKLRAFRGSRSVSRSSSDNVEQNSGTENLVRQNKPSTWKAIRVVLFTTGGVVITWVPYGISCILYVFCDKIANQQQCGNLNYALVSPLAILGFINSLLNPIIYAWWHDGFRKGIKNMYLKHKAKLIPNVFSISRNNV